MEPTSSSEFGTFERILAEKPNIFLNREVLLTSYIPKDDLKFRDSQLRLLAPGVKQILNGGHGEDMFLYGPTNTGKTVTMRYVASKLRKKDVGVVYLSGNICNTEYRVLGNISNFLVGDQKRIPSTGRPTDEIAQTLVESVKEKRGPIVVMIDDAEKIGNIGDVAYKLAHIREASGKKDICTFIAASANSDDLYVPGDFPENEWSRVIFNSYSNDEIKEIIKSRSDAAFRDTSFGKDRLDKVIDLSTTHGATSISYALKLMKNSGENTRSSTISISDVERSHLKLQTIRVQEIVQTLPIQKKVLLAGIMNAIESSGDGATITGEAYEYYQNVCVTNKIKPLTLRRVTDLINDIAREGIITAPVISKGKYGITKDITLLANNGVLKNALEPDIIL